MIDCHVHLRDQAQKHKETITHAVSIASKIGYSALFDMPNTAPPLLNAKNLHDRLVYGKACTKQIHADFFYGVYAGLTPNPEQISDVLNFYNEHFPDCIGLKMYAGSSTGNLAVGSPEEQRNVYKALSKQGYEGVLAVHCEDESLFKNELWNRAEPKTHSLVRNEQCEIESIKTQIAFANEVNFQGTLHICHISTAQGVELVCQARRSGMKITCGVTPHHALLNTSAYDSFGILAKVNPPIRSEKERLSIFNAILQGNIDWLESDHAPHTRAEKQQGASGIPGFTGMLLLINALRKAGMSEQKLQELCGGRVNAVFKTNFPVRIPSNSEIRQLLCDIHNEYEYTVYT